MTKRADSSEVLRYLTERPNQPVFRHDIAQALGLTEKQARDAVYTLRSRNGQPIVEVARGVYRYEPGNEQRNGTVLYQQVGPTKTGEYVIQDEDGNLYLARPL